MNTDVLFHISITTSSEAEEAVGELLERIFSQAASVYHDHERGHSQVSIYAFQSDPSVSGCRRTIKEGLGMISECGLDIFPAKISVRRVREADWKESWKKHFKPIAVGSGLLIKPSWSRHKPLPSQKVIVLDPGLSFGTGQHPTTAFCLQQLDVCRQRDSPQGFLDIGTGSGILAIAAAKLGYKPVHAVDSDPDAVRIAIGNANRNRTGKQVETSCRDLTKMPRKGRLRYSLICANLVDTLLVEQSHRIISRLTSDGRLVLAGILRSQFARVQSVYEKSGLKLLDSKVGGEWKSGVFRKLESV